MTCLPKTTSTNETEESKNQVCCVILSLLVCLFSLSGKKKEGNLITEIPQSPLARHIVEA